MKRTFLVALGAAVLTTGAVGTALAGPSTGGRVASPTAGPAAMPNAATAGWDGVSVVAADLEALAERFGGPGGVPTRLLAAPTAVAGTGPSTTAAPGIAEPMPAPTGLVAVSAAPGAADVPAGSFRGGDRILATDPGLSGSPGPSGPADRSGASAAVASPSTAPPTGAAIDRPTVSAFAATASPQPAATGASSPAVGGGGVRPASVAGVAAALSGTEVAFGTTGVDAWQAAGYDGSGVTIAVIDTGFAGWDEAHLAGRVPAVAPGDDVDLCDRGFWARPHGTATGEVIAAVAGGARLVRVCIDDAADLAAAVGGLIARGDIDIVNMSLGFYNTGSGDGGGPAGSPDDSARRAVDAGMVWVNAAGNEALLHYLGTFDDADGDDLHTFAAGDERGSFTVPAHAEVEVFLRWDEWGVGTPPDGFRLCFAIDPADPLDCLDAVQPVRDTPTTGVALTNRRDEPVTFEVAIRRIRGTGAPTLDLYFSDASAWEFPVARSSLVDPATVPGVVAVGAACADTGAVQAVSSQGPTLDGRPGISLIAPGASASDVFQPTADCLGGYGGTSAAAPFTAGALALLRQSDPSARRVDLVDELLARTAAAATPAPAGDPVRGAGLLSLGAPPPFGPASWSALTFQVATTSDRRDGVPLDRQVLSGMPFIYLAPLFPDPAPTRVEFYIDDTLVNVEITPTLDVGGGLPGQSFPVDTTRLADSRHRLTAVITRPGGAQEWATASLFVDNSFAPAAVVPGVLVGPDGTPLDRTEVGPDAVLTLLPAPFTAADIDHVWFWVDARFAGRVYGAPYRTDLAVLGGLEPGQHMIRAAAVTRQGALWAVDANFVVAVPVAAGPSAAGPVTPGPSHTGVLTAGPAAVGRAAAG